MSQKLRLFRSSALPAAPDVPGTVRFTRTPDKQAALGFITGDNGLPIPLLTGAMVKTVGGPPAVLDPNLVYFDADRKEIYSLDSSSELCSTYIGEGDILVFEDLSDVIVLEDGTERLAI